MKVDSRYRILSSLRQSQTENDTSLPEILGDKFIYTDVETDQTTLLRRFQHKLEQLHGEYFCTKTIIKAGKYLDKLLTDFPEKSILSHNFKLLQEIVSTNSKIGNKIDTTSDLSMNSEDFASYHGSITHADLLIARTGSIVVTSLLGGGRRLSILPPVHIVLAHRSQIVPSLENVWEKITERPMACSSLSIITGPSRTSDIEKELVLGAHGPKRLVVIVIDNTAEFR